ncbi:hypothetical protein CMI37_34740 [Candidatus Pacearchaeota archaeon]|nr:hypothetical protein [Candidatus Pacearchaeota archaeon]|tara:strand:- start:209 stop:388 length:180 start_codon:yes stop_codon:yes gene_type:complete
MEYTYRAEVKMTVDVAVEAESEAVAVELLNQHIKVRSLDRRVLYVDEVEFWIENMVEVN